MLLDSLKNVCNAIISRPMQCAYNIDKPAMMELGRLQIKQEDFDIVGIIGQGHFGEVPSCLCYVAFYFLGESCTRETNKVSLCNESDEEGPHFEAG